MKTFVLPEEFRIGSKRIRITTRARHDCCSLMKLLKFTNCYTTVSIHRTLQGCKLLTLYSKDLICIILVLLLKEIQFSRTFFVGVYDFVL